MMARGHRVMRYNDLDKAEQEAYCKPSDSDEMTKANPMVSGGVWVMVIGLSIDDARFL